MLYSDLLFNKGYSSIFLDIAMDIVLWTFIRGVEFLVLLHPYPGELKV